MTRKNKVFVVGGDNSVKALFLQEVWENVFNVADADVVCFTGGADVSPEYYNHPKHSTTYSDPIRDERETAVFAECIRKDTPMVGICRGGQLLNVLNGGEMYQDVTGHTNSHPLFIMKDGKMDSIRVTSTHHQMMKPAKHARVVATGTSSVVTYWDIATETWKSENLASGIEVVRYKTSLCFQPHPEFGVFNLENKPMRQYFFAQLEDLMSD